MENNIQIVHENGRYAVYICGAFYCNADTYEEAVNELKEDGLV